MVDKLWVFKFRNGWKGDEFIDIAASDLTEAFRLLNVKFPKGRAWNVIARRPFYFKEGDQWTKLNGSPLSDDEFRILLHAGV